MSEQLYPFEHFTPEEALEVERFGIFDDRPGWSGADRVEFRVTLQSPPAVDVAALVADLNLDRIEKQATAVAAAFESEGLGRSIIGDGRPGNGTTTSFDFDGEGGFVVFDFMESAPAQMVALVTALRAALGSLSRPVRPPREALAKALFELVNHPFQWGAEAMKATQNAWLTKADALLADADLWQPAPEAADARIARALAIIDRDVEALANLDPTKLRQALGQPVSPRTVTTVEELDALPSITLIRENSRGYRGFHLWKEGGVWRTVGGVRFPAGDVRLPASVLYVPSEGVE